MSGLKSHHFRLDAQLSFTVFTRHASNEGFDHHADDFKREYDLAQSGLRKLWSISVALIVMSVGLVALITIWPQSDLTGTHLVIIWVVVVLALVVFSAFVFGRIAKLKAEITEKRKLVEMTAGEKVR